MMAASSSRTRSSGPVHGRSALPGGRPGSSSARGFHAVHLDGTASPPLRLSNADRATSQGRSLALSARDHQISKKKPLAGGGQASRRRTCMCSPTTHPGSFRCALHKNAAGLRQGGSPTAASPSIRLNARRSAMANSVVRVGAAEGSDLIRRALAALIRPSSQQQRRRAAFQPRPSRLSTMSKAGDLC